MDIFRKTNNSRYPDALLKEASGLGWLRRLLPADLVAVPEVVAVSESELQLGYIQAQSGCSDLLAESLGEGLARMHSIPQPYFGFAEDNYIGLNPQYNGEYQSWGRFFVEKRLLAQLSMMRPGQVKTDFSASLARASERLIEYLDNNCDYPSLVHGDLWSGNYLCDGSRVWLIDPAVYFGDREVDIAMTEMFGGFPSGFYRAYQRVVPVSDDYERKRGIYNLYHYLNHYNLFGDSYLQGCERGFECIEQC